MGKVANNMSVFTLQIHVGSTLQLVQSNAHCDGRLQTLDPIKHIVDVFFYHFPQNNQCLPASLVDLLM